MMASREAEIRADISKVEADRDNVFAKREALAATPTEANEALAACYDERVKTLEKRIEALYQDLRVEHEHQRTLETGATTATGHVAGAVVTAVRVIDESRKRRWEGLNPVLDANKKAKERSGQSSTGYSYISWSEVERFFPLVDGVLGSTESAELHVDKLLALHQYLGFATTCLRGLIGGKEAKRIHFIAPILIMVCAHFTGDVHLLIEEDVDGREVHAHGHFEFVMKRGGKRLCIVEAKKDDFDQGMAQSLVGCEALCDVEELPFAYGIVTNFLNWYFIKDESDKVTTELLTIQFDEQKRPLMESLKIVANKIISILA